MKKNYIAPELNVLHIGKEICTDIIVSSTQLVGGSSAIYAPGQRGIDDYYEGY